MSQSQHRSTSQSKHRGQGKVKPSWEKIGRITEGAKVRNRRLQREEATGKRFKVTG